MVLRAFGLPNRSASLRERTLSNSKGSIFGKRKMVLRAFGPPNRSASLRERTLSNFRGSVFGERGIRTPEPRRVNGFRDRPIQPLSHLSGIEYKFSGREKQAFMACQGGRSGVCGEKAGADRVVWTAENSHFARFSGVHRKGEFRVFVSIPPRLA